MDATTQDPPIPIYTLSIVMGILSLLVSMLILGPLCWHFQNRNVGATFVVIWVMYFNLQTFINVIIWPGDDTASWFNGIGICDVEAKLQIGAGPACACGYACVLRALAKVLNPDHTPASATPALRRRSYLIDLCICLLPTLFVMTLHVFVQPYRYYIFGISGCMAAVDSSWVTIVFVYGTPFVLTLLDGYYAVLILFRLYRYRVTFSAILVSRSTTKSRFLRLYLLCLMFIIGYLPILIYLFVKAASSTDYSYSWSDNQNTINQIIMEPSGGQINVDRYLFLITGVVTFVFFGTGTDALRMYRKALPAVGLGRFVPRLSVDYPNRAKEPRNSWTTVSSSSANSTTRLFSIKKSSAPISRVDDRFTPFSHVDTPTGQVESTHLGSIDPMPLHPSSQISTQSTTYSATVPQGLAPRTVNQLDNNDISAVHGYAVEVEKEVKQEQTSKQVSPVHMVLGD